MSRLCRSLIAFLVVLLLLCSQLRPVSSRASLHHRPHSPASLHSAPRGPVTLWHARLILFLAMPHDDKSEPLMSAEDDSDLDSVELAELGGASPKWAGPSVRLSRMQLDGNKPTSDRAY